MYLAAFSFMQQMHDGFVLIFVMQKKVEILCELMFHLLTQLCPQRTAELLLFKYIFLCNLRIL